MTKIPTIKENYSFKRLYRSKKCYVYPHIVIYVAKNRLGYVRYGITTGKKIGSAVTRSRCRRIIRAAFDKVSDNVSGSYDIAFVARTRTSKVKSTELEEPIRKSLKSAGVIR